MPETKPTPEHPGWPSRSAEGAAVRWGEAHPEADLDHEPPSTISEVEDWQPGHHSAAAEAASLRWHEQHEGDVS